MAKKNLASIGALLVLAFIVGLAVAPGAVEQANATSLCANGQLCNLGVTCVSLSVSCAECGGGGCERYWEGTCGRGPVCCGHQVGYSCW